MMKISIITAFILFFALFSISSSVHTRAKSGPTRQDVTAHRHKMKSHLSTTQKRRIERSVKSSIARENEEAKLNKETSRDRKRAKGGASHNQSQDSASTKNESRKDMASKSQKLKGGLDKKRLKGKGRVPNDLTSKSQKSMAGPDKKRLKGKGRESNEFTPSAELFKTLNPTLRPATAFPPVLGVPPSRSPTVSSLQPTVVENRYESQQPTLVASSPSALPTQISEITDSPMSSSRTGSPTFIELRPTLLPTIEYSPTTPPAVPSTPTVPPSTLPTGALLTTSPTIPETLHPTTVSTRTSPPETPLPPIVLPSLAPTATQTTQTIQPSESMDVLTNSPQAPSNQARADATPFCIDYTSGERRATLADLQAATAVTCRYLENEIAGQLQRNIDVVYLRSECGRTGSNLGSTPQICYVFSVVTRAGSQEPLGTLDVDTMIQVALLPPSALILVEELQGLPSSNPFSSTSNVEMSGGVVRTSGDAVVQPLLASFVVLSFCSTIVITNVLRRSSPGKEENSTEPLLMNGESTELYFTDTPDHRFFRL